MNDYGPPPIGFQSKLIELMRKHGHRVFNVRQKPDNATYVGKGSIYVNPWRGSKSIHRRLQNIWNFYCYLQENLKGIRQELTKEDILALDGQNCICYCNNGENIPDLNKLCHSLILLECVEILKLKQ